MAGALRLGIVGCGFATSTRHLPALRRVAEVEVVALADSEPAVLAEVAGRFGIRGRYENPNDLIRDEHVEAVAVCVPAAHHVDVALAAVEAGKHVLVEKPLALSLVGADRLIARAASSPVKVQVGLNLRWHRLVREARTLLGSGQLGRVHAVQSVYSDPIVRRPGLPSWRRDRLRGGGTVFEKGVHHFDLWRFLLGGEVEHVAASSLAHQSDDETVWIGGRTVGGTLLSTVLTDSSTVSNELTLYGEAGTLHLDLYRSDGFELRDPTDLPGAPRTRLRRIAATFEQLGGNLGELRHGGAFDTSYDAEWRHFAKAVREDLEPGCSLDDGRRALAIVLAVLESAAVGFPVDIARAPASIADVAAAGGRN